LLAEEHRKLQQIEGFQNATRGIYTVPEQEMIAASRLLMRIEFASRCMTSGAVSVLPMEYIDNLDSLMSQLANARTPEARHNIVQSIADIFTSLPIDGLLQGKSTVFPFTFVLPTGHLVTGYFTVNAKLQSNTPEAIAVMEADIINQLNSITFNAQQIGMFVAADKDGFNLGAEVDGVRVYWDSTKVAAGIISVTFSFPGEKIGDFSTGASATFNIHLNRYPPRYSFCMGTGVTTRPDYSQYVMQPPFPSHIHVHVIRPPVGAPIPDVTTPPLITPPAAGEAIPPNNNIPIPVPIPIPQPPPPLPIPVPKPIPIPKPILIF